MPAFQYHVLSANRPTLWASIGNQMLRKYKLNKIRVFQKKTGNFPNNCRDVRLRNCFFSAWEITGSFLLVATAVGWGKQIVLASPQCQPKPSVSRWAEGWAQDKDSALPSNTASTTHTFSLLFLTELSMATPRVVELYIVTTSWSLRYPKHFMFFVQLS